MFGAGFLGFAHTLPQVNIWTHGTLVTATAVFPADVAITGEQITAIETWVGDDARHDAFESECADVLSRASRRCFLAFMAGKRAFVRYVDLLADDGADGLVVLDYKTDARMAPGHHGLQLWAALPRALEFTRSLGAERIRLRLQQLRRLGSQVRHDLPQQTSESFGDLSHIAA